MIHRLHFKLTCLLFSVILVSGCGLRPSETVTYITVSPGTPLQLLDVPAGAKGQDLMARGKDLKSDKVVEKQKINGWMAMPPDHWKVVKAKLNGVAKYEADNHVSIQPIADVVDLPSK